MRKLRKTRYVLLHTARLRVRTMSLILLSFFFVTKTSKVVLINECRNIYKTEEKFLQNTYTCANLYRNAIVLSPPPSMIIKGNDMDKQKVRHSSCNN
jgi:hypothetical protein